MTSLDERYRLLKCVALGGGIRTHNAQETSTGRPVMVHILDGAEPDAVEQLRQQVGTLPVADRSRILEMTPTPGGFAIVSEFLAGLTTFPQWLGARVPIPVPAPPSRPEAEAAPPRPASGATESFVIGKVESSRGKVAPPPPPGDFTRLFQSGPGTGEGLGSPAASARPAAQATPAAPVPPNAVPPSPSPKAVPAMPPAPLNAGEFTSLFTPPAAPAPKDIAASPLVGPSSPPSAAPFHTPLGGPPPVSDQRAPRRPFGSPPPSSAPPFASSSSAAFAAPSPRGSDPRPSLGSPGGPPRVTVPLSPAAQIPPMAVPPSPLTAPGQASASLPPVIAPPVFTNPAPAGLPGVPTSPLAGGRGGGPSDYTMLIRQAVTPAPPAPKAEPAPAVQPVARKRTVPLGLLIALNVVLVLAIALVLYFVFRPAPPDVTPGSPLPAAPNVTPTVPNAPKVTAPAAPSMPAVPTVKR